MERSQTRATRRALLVMGMASALGLTACSNDNTGALGAADSKASGAVTKLVVPVNESPWLKAYKGLVEEYTKETGVQIELRTFPYAELRTQILNDIKTGQHIYDVYQIDEPNTHEFFVHEWIKPIKEIDPNFTMDPGIGNYANFSYWNPQTKTSDPAGAPMVLPLNGNVDLFMYRKDLYDKLGLSVPKTWSEAVANGKKAQESGAVKYGYAMRSQATLGGGAAITYDFLPLFYSYGAKWFKDEGRDWTPDVNSPEAVAAADMMRQLTSLGPEATTTLGQAEVIGAMQAGDVLQMHVVAAAAAGMESASDSNVAGKIGYAVVPAGSAGKPGPASGTWALGVPADLPSARSKAAYDFITWVLSKKAQTKFAQLGGIPTRTDVIEDAELTDAQRAYLSAVQDSMKFIGPHVRYEFSATMLPIAERHLAAIAAGTETPQAGMSALNTELTEVITKAGYPMAK